MYICKINNFFKLVDLNNFFREFIIGSQILDYKQINLLTITLDAVSRASNKSFYVVDYYKKNFFYVSSNSLFLSGHSADEVLKLGYNFYEKVVPPQDLEMLLEINQKGFFFYYQQLVEDRLKFTISYDFRLIQPNKHTIMINHKLTPIILTPEGDVWLALCVVGLSSQTKPGNVYVNQDGVLQRYDYSFRGKNWKEIETVALTEKEKHILQLSTQGITNEQIADLIFVDVNTVKFHKKKIFQKFHVKNIAEAIVFAYNNDLI